MKPFVPVILFAVVVLLAAVCGCTGTAPPAPAETPTVVPAAETTLQPTPAPDPFPDALALNTPVAFGSGKKTGEITVTGSTFRPTFSWTDPSWNSPREQLESADPLEIRKGYNTRTPQDGNTFLFVYLKVEGTGEEAVYAPAPSQIVIVSHGTTASYKTLASGQTIVDGEPGSQYDFLIGTGGSGGYVQPGKSNAVRGFLIYEVPAAFPVETLYVVANADATTQGVWRLA
ncbi:MAG: DUF4352 domain-containing protein [Methanomicrobiales archaeon]|nr:DUF4352 domain-containing protein [Methanomicrobiales archaeon]